MENNNQNQIIKLMNQLIKDLFSCKEDRNTKAARTTLNAINSLVKEQIKEFNK